MRHLLAWSSIRRPPVLEDYSACSVLGCFPACSLIRLLNCNGAFRNLGKIMCKLSKTSKMITFLHTGLNIKYGLFPPSFGIQYSFNYISVVKTFRWIRSLTLLAVKDQLCRTDDKNRNHQKSIHLSATLHHNPRVLCMCTCCFREQLGKRFEVKHC